MSLGELLINNARLYSFFVYIILLVSRIFSGFLTDKINFPPDSIVFDKNYFSNSILLQNLDLILINLEMAFIILLSKFISKCAYYKHHIISIIILFILV